ncbi:RHS repeat domain-containing protein [Mariniflexile maritimum]|uniref:RHS repeat domain-containing protein n=1 Tax=Mariniflexile maritimum TaxID=2682493 RepID=UPI0018DD0C0F|nr:RHS repeat-associated core domain-containing protein [Mariniflexile maritimum]
MVHFARPIHLTLKAGNSILLKPGFKAKAGSHFLATIEPISATSEAPNTYARIVGDKRYELSNHLGNVLSVVTDRKLVADPLNFTNFTADVLTYSDFYPFGSVLPNRHGSSDSYRFGFQGQEKDDEIKGEGNSLNYTFRMHDPRVGRFFARDPLEKAYPFYSPYQFSGNRPIDMIELEGLEPTYTKDKDGNAIDKDGEILKQGDEREASNWDNLYHVRTETYIFHLGNENAPEGFYTESGYEYTQLDTENGQVLPPMSFWEKFPAYTEGARSWHGNGVDSKGYLTGEPPSPDITLAFGMFGGGKSKLASETIVMMGNAKKTVAGWTIYRGLKEGEGGKFLLYIGKAKNGVQNRYSLGKLSEYSIQALSKLQKIPDNGTALGVEQLIMELNGWKGKASKVVKPVLSNKINATIKDIYKSQGKSWLDANVEDWEKLFKFQ